MSLRRNEALNAAQSVLVASRAMTAMPTRYWTPRGPPGPLPPRQSSSLAERGAHRRGHCGSPSVRAGMARGAPSGQCRSAPGRDQLCGRVADPLLVDLVVGAVGLGLADGLVDDLLQAGVASFIPKPYCSPVSNWVAICDRARVLLDRLGPDREVVDRGVDLAGEQRPAARAARSWNSTIS